MWPHTCETGFRRLRLSAGDTLLHCQPARNSEVERRIRGPQSGPPARAVSASNTVDAISRRGKLEVRHVQHHRTTRAAPPRTSRFTSPSVAIEVSPGVVIARAP